MRLANECRLHSRSPMTAVRRVLIASMCTWLAACAGADPQREPPPTTAASETAPPVPEPLASASASLVVSAEPSASAAPPAAPPRLFDIAEPPLAAEIEAGAMHVRAQAWSKAKSALVSAAKVVDKRDHIVEVLVLHTLLGRTAQGLGDAKLAETELAQVRAIWGKNGPRRVEELGGKDEEKAQRMGIALTAVGEAEFFFAELARKKADAIKPPKYSGDGSRDGVQKFVNTKFRDWVQKRREAMQQAEKAYLAVLDLKPVPPPQWVIASAERVGTMKQSFLEQFSAAPMPNEWKGSGPLPPSKEMKGGPPSDLTKEEVRAAYLKALEGAIAPEREAARAAFKTCSQLAAKYGVKSDAAARCDKWLKDHPASGGP